MEIDIIQNNINELENSSTSADNVMELASLYIVKNNLKKGLNPVVSELNDIFPAYNRYISVKKEYQLNGTGDDIMLEQLKLLCQEIKEFLITLYSGTDTYKERRYISNTLSEVNTHFNSI